MCHTKMEIHFHENVTFVTGENGSGKSAILTAIQVCLGSKASATNRGSSIKDLIKSGKNKATITIHLRNEGKDAYKPSVYGKKIIVVRRIDKSSASSYLIKSEDGKVFARSGKELKMILDQFNVHIDNPTTVMTQDISRQFLASKKPTQKYQFFLKATQLSKMVEEFEKAKANKDAFVAAIEVKKEALEDSAVHLKKLEDEAIAARELATLEKKIDQLRDAHFWALVKEAEDRKNAFIEKRDEQQKEYDSMLKHHKEFQSKYYSENEKTDVLRVELDRLGRGADEATKELATLKEKQADLMKKDKTTQIIDEYKQRIRTAENQIAKTEREIYALQNKKKVDKTGEVQKIERRIESLNQKREQLTERMKESQSQLPELDVEHDKYQSEYDRLLRDKDHEARTIEKANKERQALSRQGVDKFAYFHRDLQKVYHILSDHSTEFSSVPIGPLGLLIEPKDMDWACGIEEALEKGLKNFVFHDNKDLEKFKRLMAQYRLDFRVSAIIQKHSDRKYTVDLPDGFMTIYEQLQIDRSILSKIPFKYDERLLEATVFNVLVDQQSVESTVLIADREEAIRVMFRGERPPKFVNGCYLQNGTYLFKRGKSENVMTKNKEWCRLWGKNFEQRIEQLTQEVNATQDRLKQINDQGKRVTSQKRDVEAKQAKHKQTIAQIQKELSKIDGEIRNLNNQIKDKQEEEEEDNTEQVAEYQKTIDKKQEEIEVYRTKIEDTKKSGEEFLEQKKELEAEIREHHKTIDGWKKKVEAQRVVLIDHLKEVALAKKKMDQMQGKVAESKESLISLQARVDEFTEKHEIALRVARSNATEHVDPGNRSAAQLDLECRRLEALLQERQKRFGNRTLDQVEKTYQDALRHFNDKKNALTICSRSLEKIREGLVSRHERWKKIRGDFEKMTSQYFNVFMTQKGHTGKLVFDHEQETLDLEISLTAQTSASSAISDTKSLSGGERSFSTVCFVLALWEVVESPLRALDEFDIFMDAVYRKKSIDMILKKATTAHKRRQLILISPHDTSQIGEIDKSKMKVFKMRAPDRHENQASMEDFLQRHQV
jgi:chromosome segregation ATPase